MSRWTTEGSSRWYAVRWGFNLEVFATGCGDFAWQAFDRKAPDPELSVASGDAPTLTEAQKAADLAARTYVAKKKWDSQEALERAAMAAEARG